MKAERKKLEEETELNKRRDGLKILSKYHKTLRPDFDYKKELAEWKDERYGSVN